MTMLPGRVARVAFWLLAATLVLQGTLLGSLRAAGPAHRHADAGTVVLDDVRRGPDGGAAVGAGFAASEHGPGRAGDMHAGPAHAAASPAAGHAGLSRHHHAAAADHVVADGVERGLVAASDDDGAATTPAAAFLALLAAPAGATPRLVGVATTPAGRAWPALTHQPAPPERPPRLG